MATGGQRQNFNGMAVPCEQFAKGIDGPRACDLIRVSQQRGREVFDPEQARELSERGPMVAYLHSGTGSLCFGPNVWAKDFLSKGAELMSVGDLIEQL
jgi:hypothetical protein